jgi:hypothetical protein
MQKSFKSYLVQHYFPIFWKELTKDTLSKIATHYDCVFNGRSMEIIAKLVSLKMD